MSGITGMVHAGNRAVDQAVLLRMSSCLSLRGPDGAGTWTGGGVGFSFTLLGTSAQPQALVVRGQHAIVADARIDAKDDLLLQFDPDSRITLRAATDAELMLICYQRWGCRFLEHIVGDFSFAIWDGTAGSLLCARDQLGVKPFFYSVCGGSLFFSNTLDCLRVAPGVAGDLDRQSIADFLLFGQYQDSSATAFANIRRLPAGHTLRWQSGATEIERYWTLPAAESISSRSDAEYIEGFRHFLQCAVADRSHSVRTSILMSGGLDSTMVAAVAAGEGRSVKSFAIVYDRLVPDPERHYAQVAADALQIPLQFLAADNYQLFEQAPGAHHSTAEPVDEPVPAVFTDHLMQVQFHSPVALSGVGGDQLLFPSPDFAMNLLKSGKVSQLAGGLAHFVRLRQRMPRVGFRSGILRTLGLLRPVQAEFPNWLSPDLVRDLSLHERWNRAQAPQKTSVSGDRPEAYCQLTDTAWSRIFETYDAGVTRVPVDVRHPLFDLRLVNYCLGVPPIPWFVDKTLARAAMLHRLPDAIRLRPKSYAADAVAVRLTTSPWLDDWKPVPELAQFVDRSKVPVLTAAGGRWDPHHRPFALNQWLSRLTLNSPS
jgi:asparagine synthase (glutamine-hydrolysing)